MKRAGLLNARLSEVIARMGHGDMLVIADAGLPIPSGIELIDLSVSRDLPRMLPVAEAVVGELAVERLIVASELEQLGAVTVADIQGLAPGVPLDAVSHDEFKRMSRGAAAIVRTGECSPYANVILVAGVTF